MSRGFPPDFERTLAFHGHLCLDIAMGYRVARAAMAAMHHPDPASLVATVGGDTCAVDAIQALTGCTFGKRNLVPRLTGKHAYTWQHARTGVGVRVYVHYWDRFDADGAFRATLRRWKGGELDADQAAAFEGEHDRLIRHIMEAPQDALFRITPVDAPPPPRSGGFAAAPCASCGEYVKDGLLADGLCADCGTAEYR